MATYSISLTIVAEVETVNEMSCHACQDSFFRRLMADKKSEKFFRVFYDRMKLAQVEIKTTVTVNTSDLGNRKRDDEAQDKEVPVRKKGLPFTACSSLFYWL